MMDYLCAKFSDFSFSRFGFRLSCRERELDIESQRRMIAILTYANDPVGGGRRAGPNHSIRTLFSC